MLEGSLAQNRAREYEATPSMRETCQGTRS